jgi:nitrogen fixation/metabolism regulation signal transduction histidine kinase
MEAIRPESGSLKQPAARALRYALFASFAFGAVLITLLAVASGNDRLLENHYALLLGLNVVVGLGLLLLAALLAWRLWQRWRAGLFGTRLMARMAGAFVLMTLVPAMLIYLVAVQFLGRSVESWYDVPMERALESGLTLGRASIDAQLAELQGRARGLAAELSEQPVSQWRLTLEVGRDRAKVQEALIVTGSGRILQASGGSLTQLVPDLPPPAILRQARAGRGLAVIEPMEGTAETRGLRMRVLEPISGSAQIGEDARFLQLLNPVPPTLADNAETVAQGWRDYQELALSRAGLKRIFRTTMTVTLLLTMFSAIAASFLMAGWLTGPLAMLAAGTRAVAEGDFRPVRDYPRRDELGVLTQSFNAMTRQLEEARQLVERNQLALERANAQLASVLGNLTAGVLVLDEQRRVILANDSAARILGAGADELRDRPLDELPRLGTAASSIHEAFDALDLTEPRNWQRQFAFGGPGAADRAGAVDPRGEATQTLLVRGARLPGGQGGALVVFDDVSEVVAAQRGLAWGEVARRLAHEIKNPLTPIQLAAERMQHKLASKLPPADAELLARNARTIVEQVGSLKVMVDEFSDYARLPAARLAPLDLAQLIQGVVTLYAPQEAAGELLLDCEPGLPRVLGDASQLRRVVLNLLKNALESVDRIDGSARPRVVLTLRQRLREGQVTGLQLTLTDNGPGFPVGMLERAFEPYVTSKPKGTGLGLAIVRKIIEEHGGRIELSNLSGPDGAVLGACITVRLSKLVKNDENRGLPATPTAHDGPSA